MTRPLFPSREEMTARVKAMTGAQALAITCRVVAGTQTSTEQLIGVTCCENRIGVSKVHAKRCARILMQVKNGTGVSHADIQYAKKIIVHYRRQIIELELLKYD